MYEGRELRLEAIPNTRAPGLKSALIPYHIF